MARTKWYKLLEKNYNKQNIPELRFPEFEDEWIETTLGDVVKEFINGQTPSRKHPEFWEGNIPWVSSGELNYNIINSTNEMITEDGRKSANLQILSEGTLLIAITGLEAAGTRGSCGILGINATTNQSCMALIPDTNKVTKDFLYQWYLKIGEEYGIKYTQGTKQQSYNIDILKKLPIKIPQSLNEQIQITKLLSLIDQRTEFMEKKYNLLLKIKEYFLNNMISYYKETNPTLRFNRFSTDWKKIIMEDILELIRNGTSETQVNYKTNYPVSRIETVSGNNLNLNKVGYVNYVSEDYRIKRGDILLTNINSMKFIGNVVYFESDKKLYHGMNLLLLRFNNELDKKFMYYNLKRNNLFFKKMACQAVNQASINKSTIQKMQFYLPSIKEQEKISKHLSDIDKKIDLIENIIKINKEFKKSLLSKMFC